MTILALPCGAEIYNAEHLRGPVHGPFLQSLHVREAGKPPGAPGTSASPASLEASETEASETARACCAHGEIQGA